MFIKVTQSKQPILAKIQTNKFPIKNAVGDLIYPSRGMTEHDEVTLDLFLKSIDVDTDEVRVMFTNPYNSVLEALESLTGSITMTYLDLGLKATIKLKLSGSKYTVGYSRSGQILTATFTKFKHTRTEGNYAIM